MTLSLDPFSALVKKTSMVLDDGFEKVGKKVVFSLFSFSRRREDYGFELDYLTSLKDEVKQRLKSGDTFPRNP